MNPICDYCKHQRLGLNDRGVICGKAPTHISTTGHFKSGAACVYDSDLSNLFEPRTKESSSVRDMATIIEHQNGELMKQRDHIARLESRLLDVGV